MIPLGFAGGFFQSDTATADAQIAENCYPEALESGSGKTALWQPTRVGLKRYAVLSTETAVLGCYEFNGRAFAAGQNLWEIIDGVAVERGMLSLHSTQPVGFAANHANQLIVCANGGLFVYNLATNTLNAVDISQDAPISQIGFTDSYIIGLAKDSNKFYFSGLEDGTTWSGLDVAGVERYSDNAVAMAIAFNEIWMMGRKQSIGYADVGDIDNPFQPISGGVMEQGCGAQYAGISADNSFFWLGRSASGSRMAWRANGYTPQRISNHAVETVWESYPSIADATAYSYQFRGHWFWVIYFPSANNGDGETWAYDAATHMWSKWTFWDTQKGRALAHRSRCHMLHQDKHIVGDWKSGNLYEMTGTDDFGNAIQAVRRIPYVKAGERFAFMQAGIQIELPAGDAPILFDGQGFPRDANLMLRWSDDGGRTWVGPHTLTCGQKGNYSARAIKRRMGKFTGARGRVIEVSYSDPIKGIVEVYAL